MVAAYIRFSTDKQDETQQVQAIKEWAEPRGIAVDTVEKDEGVSGGVSYKDRNLSALVRRMRPGDTLIVSEISRLGRSMSDLNTLINDELKPRKVRLVVIKSGIDMDCSNLKAIDEMIFFALSFAAQIEKEMIIQRTQSAIDARKALIERDGGFVSKAGNFCTHLGGKKGDDVSAPARASAQKRKAEKEDWRRTGLFAWVELQLRKGRPRKDIVAEAREMYKKDPERWSTRQGKPLSEAHLSLWAKDILPLI